jgi:DEAD/DEAH box helicase domain-containing protein
VEEVEVDYYTEAVWENRIEMTEMETERDLRAASLRFGYIHVNKQPKLYKKIRERSFENVGYGPITLDPFEYDTTGFSLRVPRAWKEALDGEDLRYADAALYGLSYILRRAAPSLCMADVNDIETDVSLHEEDATHFKSALYLYDAHEGGVGYAEKIFELIEDALSLCLRILDECECESGCPSCIPPLPPGVEDEALEELLIESNAAVACARSLLSALLTGTVTMPEIQIHKVPAAPPVEPPEPDAEAIKLGNRLTKASAILKKKREKLH